MKLPAQCGWKNTSVLYVAALGRMPMFKNCSEHKKTEKNLNLTVNRK